jgi:phosphodiesterase/alkaline phosphatase D-like protein
MTNKSNFRFIVIALAIVVLSAFAYQSNFIDLGTRIPKSLSSISIVDNEFVFTYKGENLKLFTVLDENKTRDKWQLSQFDEVEKGNQDGIDFVFKKDFNGTLIYGLYGDEPMNYPFAVYFKKHEKIVNGKASINIRKRLSGKYDLAHWETNKKGRLAYRILDSANNVIFNKSISFTVDKQFTIVPDIVWGPILSCQDENSICIKFATNLNCAPIIKVNNKEYKLAKEKNHEITISGLESEHQYEYTIQIENITYKAELRTAPKAGCQEEFTFAFASDSRGGTLKGVTETKGHNADILKKLAAMAVYKKVDFWQFTGDMIDGYKIDRDELNLEYTNWLTSITPFMHSTPLNVGMGNHEILMNTFGDPKKYLSVDGFPYDSRSGESVFAAFFANPKNGPESEDGSKYDPDNKNIDFPSYKENVYSYTYGNMAMIVLHSNYWYTPNHHIIPEIGGNAHGYVMDNQLAWLESEMNKYESDPNIQHIFVSIHTPAFPNGGHAKNDMWYDGNNEIRPWIAGKPVEKGIIERRDEMLDILVNKSKKFRVLLTGDEHNYSRLVVDENTDIYPKDWKKKKLKLSRPFVQIVDGAAGAPYYAQENLPWTPSLKKFSSQYALVLFTIAGKKIEVEVINPNTLETIEKVEL